jgi:hypothetical protein
MIVGRPGFARWRAVPGSTKHVTRGQDRAGNTYFAWSDSGSVWLVGHKACLSNHAL